MLDYAVFLQEASRLSDVPFMLEHLETQKEYKLAADYVRKVGKEAGISFAFDTMDILKGITV